MTQKQFKIKSIQPISVNELQPSPELMEVQSFLPISGEDRERLKKDIEKSGEIRDPVKIYYDNDGNPMILGGFNRWHIAQELGWEFVPCEVMSVAPKERRELAIMDNLARRHMTRDQKQKIVEMFLRNDPVQSDRTIAKKTGADHKTVGTVRSKLEATGEIPQLEKRAGADGRIRKANPVKPDKSKKEATGEIPQLGKKPVQGVSPANPVGNKQANSFEPKINKLIMTYETYIKQLNKKKLETEKNQAQVSMLRVVISDLKELLKQ
ncbi:MAG TPA: ParB N-terminal domain-containing protein [Spirochaetota bacterium]|nr:ParB N-terminal domain-containing protein [Spirochaetota bacterium]